MRPRILVIGGGISGLSAAYYIQQALPDARITVVERENRWGGKLLTERVSLPDGSVALVEGGAESFVTRKPEVWELAHELNLQIVPASSSARRICVLHYNQLRRAPLDPLTFITTPLLSMRGKLRMLAEPFIAPRCDGADESLARFVDRRFGREAREKFIGPILGGIYNTDPETQSLLTTAPVMRELEGYGSVMAGAVARAWERRGQPRRPAFISFASGAQALADALAQRLRADLRCGVAVQALAGANRQWQATLDSAETLTADAVVVTTPANVAAQFLADAAPGAAAQLHAIRHNHIGTLSLIYRAAELPALEVGGVMIPRRTRRPIDALTCERGPGRRLPAGYVLLKVFFGGGDARTAELDDVALLAVVQRELRALLGIAAEPLAWRTYRWLNAFPQADVGHLERVAEIERALPPGIFLAGAAYRGLGVSDCIRQARAAALSLTRFISDKATQ